MSTGLRLKRATPFAIAIAIWFLPFRPGSPRRPGICSRSSPRPSRRCCSARSAAHGLDARRGRGCAHRDDHAGTGLLGLRQLERAARGDRVHRRAGRGEVGARPADQPLHGEPLRRLLARAGLRHRAHRRGHRAGLPTATRRAAACSSRSSCPWPRARAPSRGPRGRRLGGYLMFCAMAGLAVSSALWMTATSCQPDRRADRAEGRARDRVREVVARLFGALADRDRAAAPARREALPAARGQDPRGPRGGAQGTRRHGDAVARRVDHGRNLRVDGRRLGVRSQAEPQHDQRRVHGLRRAAVPGRDHARRHHQAGRHAGDLPLARSALRHERAAERTRLHGLRRRAPRRGLWAACPGRPCT